MLLRHWLERLSLSVRSLSARQRSAPKRLSRRPRRRRRAGHGGHFPWTAQVEHLEDRTLLTAYLVDTNADFDATNPADPALSDGDISLREAIIAANTNSAFGDAPAGSGNGDTIDFALTAGNETIDLAFGELPITDDVTIDGSNAAGIAEVTIDANALSRIFAIDTDDSAADGDAAVETVTIDTLTITDGDAGGANGGAVSITGAGTTNLDNLSILNSTTGATGSGGGIAFTGGTLNVTNSLIDGNTAAVNGGGIEIGTGTVTLTDVQVGLSAFNDLTHLGNTAGANGGGVHISGDADVTVAGGSVSGNTAGLEGGGLWNSATGTLTLTDTATTSLAIQANVANGNADPTTTLTDIQGGGGLFNNGGTVAIDGTIATPGTGLNLQFNEARGAAFGSGGGILSVGGTVTVDFSLIRGNEAVHTGGGIEIVGGELIMTSANIQSNDASIDNDLLGTGALLLASPGSGAGLHIDGSAVVTLDDVAIQDNVAQAEGGGVWVGDTATLNLLNSGIDLITSIFGVSGGVLIQNNEARGNVDPAGVGNTAADLQGGGGLFNEGGTVNITGATIQTNTATGTIFGAGGGILSIDGDVSITESTVDSNTATLAGGGIHTGGADSGTLNLTRSTVSNNTATTVGADGGGIFAAGGTSNVVNSTVSSNIAADDGGGIYVDADAVLALLNATIEANTAGDEGDGIFVESGATVTADNTIFSHSTGGGLDDVGGPGTITGDNNLVQEADVDADVNGTGNLFGVNPLLGPLADNGGPTQTHDLLSGSPALNVGSDAAATGLTVDQRGGGFERIRGVSVDIGAVEVQAPTVLTLVNGHGVVTGTFDSPDDFDDFTFTASSGGRFQISVVTPGDDASFTVFDSLGNIVGHFDTGDDVTPELTAVDNLGDSYETAWFELTAGADYTVRVDHNDGGTGPFTLEVSDVFFQDGTTLYVNGSLGDDVFNYLDTGAGFEMTMNGVTQVFLPAAVDSILPQGWEEFGAFNAAGAPGDLAVLQGGVGIGETAILGVGGGVLIRQGDQIVTMAEFETSAFYGQQEDSGQLTDSAGVDFFVTAGTYSYMTSFGGAPSFHLISGVSNVYGYTLNGGADQAFHYDTAGNDTYVASGTAYSYMSSGSFGGANSFFNVAVGFDVNYGFSLNGGFDFAYFYDSVGNDTFVSEPAQAYMSGPGFFNAAIGFDFHIGQSFVGGSSDFDTAFNRAPAKTLLAGFDDINT